MATKVLPRTRAKPRTLVDPVYITNQDGTKAAGCPDAWPFGRKPRPTAKRKVNRKMPRRRIELRADPPVKPDFEDAPF